eukprot:gene24157-36902_t
MREAQISRTQHEAETQMAQEQLSEFAQNKVHILLQGFNAISSIFHNIAWIASLLMGFTATMYGRG